jgi:hypothetical protein
MNMWAVIFSGLIEDCKVFDTKEEALECFEELEDEGYNNITLVEWK